MTDTTPTYDTTNYTDEYGKIDYARAMNCSRLKMPQLGKKNMCTGLWEDKETTNIGDILPAGRWFIHSISVTTNDYSEWSPYSSGPARTNHTITLFDNYGQIYTASNTRYNRAEPHTYDPSFTVCKQGQDKTQYMYRLPNVLIDYCKTFSDNPDGKQTDALQRLAAQYYKDFTLLKPLIMSGELIPYTTIQVEKQKLDEQLREVSASYQSMKEQYEELKKKFDAISARSQAMEKTVEEQKNTISTKQKEFNSIQQELQQSKLYRAKLNSEYQQLQKQIAAVMQHCGLHNYKGEDPLYIICKHYTIKCDMLEKERAKNTALAKECIQIETELQKQRARLQARVANANPFDAPAAKTTNPFDMFH